MPPVLVLLLVVVAVYALCVVVGLSSLVAVLASVLAACAVGSTGRLPRG